MAVTQRVQQDGQWRDGDTSFFKVNVWRGQAENLAESLGKGDRVMVAGRLRQRSWETPEGDKRSVTELEADEVGASLKWARPRSNGPASAATGTAPKAGSGPPSAAATSTKPTLLSIGPSSAPGSAGALDSEDNRADLLLFQIITEREEENGTFSFTLPG